MKYLFIGGPCDGEWHEASGRNSVDRPHMVRGVGESAPKLTRIAKYRKMLLVDQGVERTVYVFLLMTDLQALDALIKNYKPKKEKNYARQD